MFRLSEYVREVLAPTPLGPQRTPPGPVVIWNLIRRCNLRCKHCYSISADRDFEGELSTSEIYAVMDDLKAFGVPALILSNGEPLLRPDIFAISERAKAMRFYVGLSSNGTAIDQPCADRIAEIGYDYVGISLDGMEAVHDGFRRKEGAFAASLAAVRLLKARGIKVGLRFTMTQDNEAELPAMLELLEREGVDRFYFSHLNYAGRGNVNRADDARFAATRRAMTLLIERALWREQASRPLEIVTGNNDADGVFFLHWVQANHPDRADGIRARLERWGGNASGVHVANIDNLGVVHPDTMWWHYGLGNVRERPFSAIWRDTSDPLMAGLKRRPRAVAGRCGACAHLAICGGNTRVRAHQVSGDVWAEDPGCYLTDAEIGVAPGERLGITPYGRKGRAA